MARDRLPDAGISGLPFDDVRSVLRHFPDFDETAVAAARRACAPLGSLGDLAAWLVGWRGLDFRLNRIQVAVYISLVNAGGTEVDEPALRQAQDFLADVAGGGRPLSQLALVHGAGLNAYDLALEVPTGDITCGAAMDERECAGAMAFGMEAIAGGPDVMVVARAGSGGDIASAAVLGLIYPDMANRLIAHFCAAGDTRLEQVIACHRLAGTDPFELLRRVGSRDMAAIAGVIMAARTQRIPVVLGGIECLTVCALLEQAGTGNTAHCLAAHRGDGVEAELVERLDLLPVCADDLGGEPGAAAGIAIGTLKSAAAAAGPLLQHLQKMNAE
ncbi:MAG: hypothetical protein D6763_05870 [Alphaproteobacteria bacterium]|nr:MAG: hypothetical protein D6763_05870 [Alphaproteobacteria bacterium]